MMTAFNRNMAPTDRTGAFRRALCRAEGFTDHDSLKSAPVG
jgi:hypothetical protein